MKTAAQDPDGNESLQIVLRATAQQFYRDRVTMHRDAELH